jgi:hypothetical protein
MSDAMHKFRDQQRQQQKAAYQEAQRRQAELNATVGEWSQDDGAGQGGAVHGKSGLAGLPPTWLAGTSMCCRCWRSAADSH